VANLSTPGYRRREVSFDETLRQAVVSGDSRAVTSMEPKIVHPPGGSVKPDGNNVSFQDEYARMVKNRVLFEMVNEAVRWRYNLHREAMRTW
jgi:flagellar basal-body rod protein FlgB